MYLIEVSDNFGLHYAYVSDTVKLLKRTCKKIFKNLSGVNKHILNSLIDSIDRAKTFTKIQIIIHEFGKNSSAGYSFKLTKFNCGDKIELIGPGS